MSSCNPQGNKYLGGRRPGNRQEISVGNTLLLLGGNRIT